jgi:hypothetical protein
MGPLGLELTDPRHLQESVTHSPGTRGAHRRHQDRRPAALPAPAHAGNHGCSSAKGTVADHPFVGYRASAERVRIPAGRSHNDRGPLGGSSHTPSATTNMAFWLVGVRSHVVQDLPWIETCAPCSVCALSGDFVVRPEVLQWRREPNDRDPDLRGSCRAGSGSEIKLDLALAGGISCSGVPRSVSHRGSYTVAGCRCRVKALRHGLGWWSRE